MAIPELQGISVLASVVHCGIRTARVDNQLVCKTSTALSIIKYFFFGKVLSAEFHEENSNAYLLICMHHLERRHIKRGGARFREMVQYTW